MKRPVLAILFLCLLYGGSIPEPTRVHQPVSVAVTPKVGKVLIKLSEGILSEAVYEHNVGEIKDNELKNVLLRYSVHSLQSIFKNRYTDSGCLKHEVISSGKQLLSSWFEITLSDKFDARELLEALKKQQSVVNVLLDVPLQVRPDIVPDDDSYAFQWHLNNPDNQNFDIDAEAAWDINTGRNDVIIAVLDGGIDYTHTDLDPGDRSRIISGIDTGDDDSDPMDDLPTDSDDSFAGHGTAIAGVIGAIANNNQEVSGVMWNCRIMPVKMVRSGGIRIPHIYDWDWSTSAFPSDVADAIDYAVNNGADIINLSYSFPDMGYPLDQMVFQQPLIADALKNAYQNNVVITASMGNEFQDDNRVRYPAGFEEYVIAVGATNEDGTRRASSNTGAHISLSAPGTAILTTERGGGLTSPNGTSFSAPLVAGVAGLVISQGKDRTFDVTNDDVKHILQITATDITQYGIGFDEQTGYGIVNAHHALQLIDEPNELYHYKSTGGTATKVTNFSQWILLDGRWGIAAGTYLDVDQYKVTKHVTFDVPFCEPPTVWMRERESKTMNYGNPNDSSPFASITNVTATGFDLEYVVYYVRYNTLGQSINKWLPATAASTYVAYTAVGQPNRAALATISGPDLVCSSGSQFTLNNLPAGATVTWNQSGNLSRVSAQGSNPCTFAATGVLSGWVEASITANCRSVTIRKQTLVGAPYIDPGTFAFTNGIGESGYFCRGVFGNEFSFTYPNSYNYFDIRLTNQAETNTIMQFTQTTTSGTIDANPAAGTYLFQVRGNNGCGTGAWGKTAVQYINCALESVSLSVSPTPSSEETTISIVTTSDEPIAATSGDETEWQLEVLTFSNEVKEKRGKLKGRSVTLDTSNWDVGIYIIRVNYRGQVLTGKMIKETSK